MREMIASRGSGRVMGPIVFHDRRISHRPVVAQAERDRLAGELRRALLALHAHVTGGRSSRARRLHQDIQQRKNKAPDTLATLFSDAFNDRAPLADIQAFCNVVVGFFTAKRRGHARTLRDVSPIETRAEGDLNVIQVAIDQGDHSSQTLSRFIEECDVNISLLAEMKQAATEELYGPQEARV